jgi:hypothetical protein
MNNRWLLLSTVIAGLTLLPGAHAAAPPAALAEIDYLLEFVETSGCEFYRNGTWHDSVTARAHLRTKYEAYASFSQINTAEAFIEKAATKSSITGEAYEARCNGGEVVTSKKWLTDALTRHRADEAAKAEAAKADVEATEAEAAEAHHT